jgi:DNA-binding NtrC family response regulator
LPAILSPPAPESVLVVDDDQDMCWALEGALASLGCAVTSVGTGGSAIAVVTESAFPVAFVDARLPDMDGMRLIAELRALRPSMRIIMISGYFLENDVRILEAVKTSAIDGFLAKPFQIDAIVAAALGYGNGRRRPIP